jgi:hypothetical protein
MSASIYTEKLVKPDDTMLACDLGEAKSYLDKITGFIESEYGDFVPEWKFYNQKSGWILKLFTKKRNVLFVIPCDNYFRVSFTLGEKASDLVFNSQLPVTIKKELLEAKQYAEGRTIQIEVKAESDSETYLN